MSHKNTIKSIGELLSLPYTFKRIEMKSKDTLISIISKASNRYGDKLIDFMDKYKLINLQSATEDQLIEYINEMGFTGGAK